MYIYKIYSKNPEDPNIYIGSTKDFKDRMRRHKGNCNNEKSHAHNCFIYQYIRQNGGFDNFDCEIIHEFECKDNQEKFKIEQKYINSYSFGLNSRNSYTDKKEYNRDFSKKYRVENKNKVKAYNDKYGEKYRKVNKEKLKEKSKIKMACECGSTFRKSDKSQHIKTKKHQKYINELII